MIIKYFKFALISIFVLLPYHSTISGDKPLSREAMKLQQALYALDKNPKSNTLQIHYLKIFPKDIKKFKQIFAQQDFSELYSGSYNYIFRLRDLSKEHPIIIGNILISLSKDAYKDADAMTYLQTTTSKYAVNYTAMFVKLLKRCSKNEIANLIKYLADVENHSAYEEYPIIIKNLRKLGENILANQFVVAKRERMASRDH